MGWQLFTYSVDGKLRARRRRAQVDRPIEFANEKRRAERGIFLGYNADLIRY